MKTTILSVVLALIVGLICCSDESKAGTEEPEDPELRTLMVEHRDTLKKIVLFVDTNARKGMVRL